MKSQLTQKKLGLLPDIELSLKDVFDPLLKLGSLDENIARLLFVSVVVPIWTSFLGNISISCSPPNSC